MESNSPTFGPDGAPAPADHTMSLRRGRSLLGLPAKLAVLLLAAVAAFVLVLVGLADHQVSSTAQQRARDVTRVATERMAASFTAADFLDGPEAVQSALDDHLDQLRQGEGSVRALALVAARGDGSTVLARSGDGSADLARFGREDVRAGDDRFGGSTGRVRLAHPMDFAGSDAPPAVLVVEYDTADLAADLRTARLQLWLGAVVAGSLLAATLLLLLRRELFRPLDELRRAMQQIGSGATGVRIGWNRTDELGLVASEFDSMVAQLEAAQAELSKYVRHDPLTGLLTAEAFTDRFAAELTRARREGYPITLLAIDVDQLDEVNTTHDRAAGDQVLADIGSVISGCTRPTDACGRTGGDSFHVALVGAEVDKAAVVVDRIRAEIAQRVGIGPERTRVTCGYGIAEYPRHAVDQIALERMAQAACAHAQRDGRDHALAFGPSGGYVDVAELVPDDERSVPARPAGSRELSSTVHALARSLDGIDPILGGGAHSQRVARYAAAIARDLGHGDGVLRELRSAAVLHDVGKVAVPPAILRTPEDQLDERQRGALRYHAWVARTMIAGAGLASVADVVFHMPERWDGTGYPERLREEAIPASSRILRAAELLDDLTTRAVREGRPLTPFEAASELKRRAGSELDPDIAMCLARLVREEGLVGNVAARGDEDEAAPAQSAEAA